MNDIKIVDARGLSCPEPTIRVRQAMKQGQSPIQVLVDTGTSRDNVSRMAQGSGWQVAVEARDDGYLADVSDQVMIYLDHAATSWPKPPQVLAAMHDFLAQAGGNPGRSGHRLSIAAGRIVYDAREAVAELFGAPDPLRVIFTLNATHAINIALHGLLQPGDRVVTSGIEHNAVMRPLRAMAQPNVPGTAAVPGTWAHGIDLAVVPCHADGTLDMAAAQRLITPGVRLVALNHASNVMGTILPVAQVAALARRAGALLLVDAAQTAGALPIDMAALGIDLLAFTGHKALLGPPGTGGLVIGERRGHGQHGAAAARRHWQPLRVRGAARGLPRQVRERHPQRRGHRRAGRRHPLCSGPWLSGRPWARDRVDARVGRGLGEHPRRDRLRPAECRPAHGRRVDHRGRPAGVRGRVAAGRGTRRAEPGGPALCAGCASHHRHLP
jgi:TusA-related sulfurtransferase